MARYFTLDLVPQLGGQLGLISAEVRYANTSSAVAIFQDQALTTPIANPIVITSGYNLSFWVADGTQNYDIQLIGGNLISTVFINDIWTLPAPIWGNLSVFWSNQPNVWAYITPYTVAVSMVSNVGQLYTANDLVRAAMRLIQVSSVDTDLTANELKDGIESLNRMLDSWSADELMLYQITRETFPLSSGTNPYTIGLGAMWNTIRPSRIIDAYFTIYTGSIPVDYPMQIMEWDDYNAVRLKSLQTNFPGYLFYDRGFPIGNAYIYPICSSSNETITLTSWKPFTVVNDPTAYISLPPGYWEAIVFNLAIRIAEEYQFDIRQTSVALAQNAIKRIKRINQRTPTLSTDVALMSTSQMRYNIYSDGYGR